MTLRIRSQEEVLNLLPFYKQAELHSKLFGNIDNLSKLI
jgi:hypothetical protein